MKLQYDKLLSNFVFKFNVCRYTMPVSTYEVKMMKSEEQVAAEARSLFGGEDFTLKAGRCSLNP